MGKRLKAPVPRQDETCCDRPVLCRRRRTEEPDIRPVGYRGLDANDRKIVTSTMSTNGPVSDLPASAENVLAGLNRKQNAGSRRAAFDPNGHAIILKIVSFCDLFD